MKREPGRTAGHTVVVRLEGDWFWLIPRDRERTSVGLVTTLEAMRAAKLAPEELFWCAVGGSAQLREFF